MSRSQPLRCGAVRFYFRTDFSTGPLPVRVRRRLTNHLLRIPDLDLLLVPIDGVLEVPSVLSFEVGTSPSPVGESENSRSLLCLALADWLQEPRNPGTHQVQPRGSPGTDTGTGTGVLAGWHLLTCLCGSVADDASASVRSVTSTHRPIDSSTRHPPRIQTLRTPFNAHSLKWWEVVPRHPRVIGRG